MTELSDAMGGADLSMTDAKQRIFEQLAELARTLGHAKRLELIEHMAQGARPVDRLAELTGMSQNNTSQHLQQLRRAGIVRPQRDGRHTLYGLAGGPLLPVLAALRGFAEEMDAEVQSVVADYFERLDSLDPVTREELIARLAEDRVTILDVRPEDEFRLGHVPGALNIPLAELESRLAELPRDREIVAYCRGPHCVLSFEAVAALRERGFTVRRLEDGYPEWAAAAL